MGKEKEKTRKKELDPKIKVTLRRWDNLREKISKSWDNELSALEEIRAQRER